MPGDWWRLIWEGILRRGGMPGLSSRGDPAVTGSVEFEFGAEIGATRWVDLPGSIDPSTPLDGARYLSLDTESTGLDPSRDSVVSIGAVPVAGGEVAVDGGFEILVNPRRKIPENVVAIHGIGDDMVAGAPDFTGIVDRLLATIDGSVILGHHIGFDFALLRRETLAAGRQWKDLPALDTLLLAAIVWPRERDLSLDALARRFNVADQGRHTARGDAIMTAEVFLRLLPLLRDQGILTLGAALAAQELARRTLLLRIKSRRWRWRWI